jgi:antitoxin component YwqK of YwqJK toxin-antitoxin module
LEGWVRVYFKTKELKKEEFYKNGVLQTRKEYNAKGILVSTYGYDKETR